MLSVLHTSIYRTYSLNLKTVTRNEYLIIKCRNLAMFTCQEHLFLEKYKSVSLAHRRYDIKYVYRKIHINTQIKFIDDKVGTFCSQLIVVSTTQLVFFFSHITLRKGTETSRCKRNYAIGVGENLSERLRDQL